MEARYGSNDWGEEEQERLRRVRVCVVGCGGLGGRAAELLARAGVGTIVLIDGDRFTPGNLNRQCFATEDTLGQEKVRAAAQACSRINPAVRVCAVPEMLTAETGVRLLRGADAVVDGLDNVRARALLVHICQEEGLPLVHGAVCGWQGQASTLLPGDEEALKLVLPSGPDVSLSGGRSTPFAPAWVAAVQAAETVRLLLGCPPALAGKLLTADLMTQEYRTYRLGPRGK